MLCENMVSDTKTRCGCYSYFVKQAIRHLNLNNVKNVGFEDIGGGLLFDSLQFILSKYTNIGSWVN